MKFSLALLLFFCLTLSPAKTQTTKSAVTGKFVGNYKWEGGHAVITVKKNHHFTIKKYDWSGKCVTTTKGDWNLEGDKLVLNEASGKKVILERSKEPDSRLTVQAEGWYIYGSRAYSYDGYFYHGLSAKEFRKKIRAQGC